MKTINVILLGVVAYVLLSKPAPRKTQPATGGLVNDLLGLGRQLANAFTMQPHELPSGSSTNTTPPSSFADDFGTYSSSGDPGSPNFVGPPTPDAVGPYDVMPTQGTPPTSFDPTQPHAPFMGA